MRGFGYPIGVTMIDIGTRQMIWKFFQEGKNIADISRRLEVDRKTVALVIKTKGEPPLNQRRDTVTIDEGLLKATFQDCDGWIERIHEVLRAKGVEIGYSTLTRMVRNIGLGEKKKKRAERVPDRPGEEFQHDTSPYTVKLGERATKVQASQIYFRFSKRRYLKFYLSFTRFIMKCFFHEALSYFEYICARCIIDNTNLAVKEGTGRNAIFNQEMLAFAKIYDFEWMAHEVCHSDRKAGVERSFWTAETNFFPGRTFASLEDLNRQAFDWSEKHSRTPNKKTKLIPIEIFEHEKTDMKKLPSNLPAPYLSHFRLVDQYGYIAFDANSYWIPKGTEREVLVLQYADSIKIYSKRKPVAEYPLPPFGTRRSCFFPNGLKPTNRPAKVTIPSTQEEAKLMSMGKEIEIYLQGTLKGSSKNNRHRMIRKLYLTSLRLSPSLFLKTVQRSMEYGIFNVDRLEAISVQVLGLENFDMPTADIKQGFEERENYLLGEFTDCPELSEYDNKYNGRNNGKKN